MIASVNSAASALQAYNTKMGVSAYNIANANTEEFKKSSATLGESANGTVEVNVRRVDTPGHRYQELTDGGVVEKETSNVDLGEELPEMMITKRGYQANLKTLQTYDKMLGTLLNIMS